MVAARRFVAGFSILFCTSSVPAPAATAPASAPAATQPVSGMVAVANSPVFFVRDSSVQGELKLTDEQRKAVGRLMDEIDGPLWPLRDLPAEKSGTKIRELVAKGEAGLKGILTPPQWTRIEQISLQAKGPRALSSPDVAERFALSDAQRRKIERITAAVQEAFRKAGDLAPEEKRRETIEKAAQRLRQEEGERILAVLTEKQQERWSAMLGEAFDLSRVRAPPFKAPEIRDATAWVNTGPLTLAGLRGNVVVLHFWTFGCANCIRNDPHYKAWQEAYAKKGLTILGIHTPETQGEHDIESVKKKAREHGLTFPIAVDNDRKNWDAWGNRVWPAVYLVDRKGYVRYWWYGELNWKGSEGETFMRRRIDELLGEKQDGVPDTTAPPGPR